MRSLLALIVCTGLIAWAHATKHKYFGLRASEPTMLSISGSPASPAITNNNDGQVKSVAVGFHLSNLQKAYMRSLYAIHHDSLWHARLLAHDLHDNVLLQMQ